VVSSLCRCVGSKGSELNQKEEQEEAMQVDDGNSSESDEEIKEERMKRKKKEAGVAAGSKKDPEGEDKLQQVVNEDTKWVELLFDSMNAATSDEN